MRGAGLPSKGKSGCPCLQLNLALEDEVSWTGKGDSLEATRGVPFEFDPEGFPPFHVDIDRGSSAVEQVMNDRAGHHPRAAGQGFALDPPFIRPDRNVSWRDFSHEVGIRAVGKVFVVTDCGSELEHVKAVEVLNEGDSVGNARVDAVDRAFQSAHVDRSVQLEIKRVGHCDLDVVASEPGTQSAGHGFEAQGLASIGEEAGGVASKAAGPVSAHLSLATICVVVAEPEIGRALGGLGGKKTIGAYPTMPIADPGDLLGA